MDSLVWGGDLRMWFRLHKDLLPPLVGWDHWESTCKPNFKTKGRDLSSWCYAVTDVIHLVGQRARFPGQKYWFREGIWLCSRRVVMPTSFPIKPDKSASLQAQMDSHSKFEVSRKKGAFSSSFRLFVCGLLRLLTDGICYLFCVDPSKEESTAPSFFDRHQDNNAGFIRDSLFFYVGPSKEESTTRASLIIAKTMTPDRWQHDARIVWPNTRETRIRHSWPKLPSAYLQERVSPRFFLFPLPRCEIRKRGHQIRKKDSKSGHP